MIDIPKIVVQKDKIRAIRLCTGDDLEELLSLSGLDIDGNLDYQDLRDIIYGDVKIEGYSRSFADVRGMRQYADVNHKVTELMDQFVVDVLPSPQFGMTSSFSAKEKGPLESSVDAMLEKSMVDGESDKEIDLRYSINPVFSVTSFQLQAMYNLFTRPVLRIIDRLTRNKDD